MATKMKLMGASSIAALMAADPQEPESAAEDAEAGPEPAGESEEAAGDEAEASGNTDKEKDEGAGKDKESEDAGDEVEAVSTNDAAAFAKEQRAEGVTEGQKAERDRTAAVLGSEEGKANYADASFMLANTDASADKIIAELKSRGPAAETSTTTDTNAGIEDTDVDLGHGTDPAAALDEGAEGGDKDPWASSIDRVSTANGLTAPVAPAASVQPNAAGNITIPASHNGVGH